MGSFVGSIGSKGARKALGHEERRVRRLPERSHSGHKHIARPSPRGSRRLRTATTHRTHFFRTEPAPLTRIFSRGFNSRARRPRGRRQPSDAGHRAEGAAADQGHLPPQLEGRGGGRCRRPGRLLRERDRGHPPRCRRSRQALPAGGAARDGREADRREGARGGGQVRGAKEARSTGDGGV
mgnify:CR=1 FL=1